MTRFDHERAPARTMERPRLAAALVRRELDAGLVAGLLLAAAGAAAAAYQVHGGHTEGLTTLIERLLRRFDLAVGGLMIPFIVLRTAARIEADHEDGWLAPFVAAGGRRWSYGVASCAAALLAPAIIFAAAAISFAGAVVTLSGNAELVAILPYTLAAGILALATVSVCTVALGISLRRAGSTILVTGVVMLLPMLLLGRYALMEAGPPLWAMITPIISPLLVAPGDAATIVRAVLYVVIVGALAGLASHRFAARTP